MKRGTLDHPKLRRLARVLRINQAWAAGILEALWQHARDYAPRGDVGRHDDIAIAEAVYWPTERDATELVDALVQCGWLERHDEFRIVIHDWSEHCEDAVHAALVRLRQPFWDGRMPKSGRLNAAQREQLRVWIEDQTRGRHSAVCLPPSQNGTVTGSNRARGEKAKAADMSDNEADNQAPVCRSHSHSLSHSPSAGDSAGVYDGKHPPRLAFARPHPNRGGENTLRPASHEDFQRVLSGSGVEFPTPDPVDPPPEESPPEWPARLAPIREAIREHARAIGKEQALERDIDLAERCAEAAGGNAYAAASTISKKILRDFGRTATRRRPWPKSLGFWVTALREEFSGETWREAAG